MSEREREERMSKHARRYFKSILNECVFQLPAVKPKEPEKLNEKEEKKEKTN
jgi:hypothetical protein